MNLRLILLPFSFLYAGAARFRNFLFDTGFLKSHRFKVPVILVGNLSVGGTGKTPHVEYLLGLLRKNYRLATLSRGYGRESKGFVIAGKGVSSDIIGDEPMQYFTKFEDVTVAVCENRVEGITRIVDLARPDVIIMDDGFQHRHANPGYKILLTAFDKLYTNDYVLPAGDLREPRAGYKRADCIVVTRSNAQMNDSVKEQIIKKLHPLPNQPVFFSSVHYDKPRHFFDSTTLDPAHLTTKNVLLFSGIANAGHLESYLKNHCAFLESIRFPDHHVYDQKDLKKIREKFDKFAADPKILVTTEKDYQRIRSSTLMQDLHGLPCYFVPIEIKLDRQEVFNNIITTYVKEYTKNS